MIPARDPIARGGAPPPNTERSLLLELPVPFRRRDGRLQVESQALNGLRRWSDHFERMTVCAPVIPEPRVPGQTMTWEDPGDLPDQRRIVLHGLPWAYHPLAYARAWRPVARDFDRLIPAHRYLCFSGVGGFGSWGNVAARRAARQRRPYAVWFDWVVERMPASGARGVKQAIKALLDRHYTTRETHQAIRRSQLGLFHGRSVYEAYAPLARNAALVHDVHLGPESAIGAEALAAKLASIRERRDLRVGYVGRLHPMKAPLDWIAVVTKAGRALGAGRLQATWLGDGPLRADAEQRIARESAAGWVRFPGQLHDRAELLRFLRETDVFVFCHVTPESPRCLVEALVCGAPLVGYESAYAADLVEGSGGAVLVPVGDIDGLAANLVRLADDREALCALVERSAASGRGYNDEAVFRHRSDLIRLHLP